MPRFACPSWRWGVVAQRGRPGSRHPSRYSTSGAEALAERLFLSHWTVQDHLKSIFEKTRTRSRRELRAQIFYQEFLPGIATRAPLDADGALVPGAARGHN